MEKDNKEKYFYLLPKGYTNRENMSYSVSAIDLQHAIKKAAKKYKNISFESGYWKRHSNNEEIIRDKKFGQ